MSENEFSPSLDFLNSALDSASDGVVVSGKNGTILIYNGSMERITGYTKEEAQAADFPGVLCLDQLYKKKAYDCIKSALNGNHASNHEWEITCKNGEKKIVLVSTSLIYANDKRFLVSTVKDISLRKEAEEALRRSEEKYFFLMNFAADAIILTDDQGNVIEVNKMAQRLLGYSKEEFLKLHYRDIPAPERLDKAMDALRDTFENGQLYYRDALVVRKDGKRIPVDVNVTVLELHGAKVAQAIIRDISERKKAEETMRFHSEIITNMAEGIVLIQPDSGEIVYANRNFEEHMFGYSQGELIGKNISSISAPTENGQAGTTEKIGESLNKTGVWRGEVYNKKKNGEHFWCHASVTTFEHHEYGTVWISYQTDITVRKQAEEVLRQLSSTDSLTGIANRRSFDEAIEREWRRALRDAAPISLIMLDIDYFKLYNDKYGHQMGDNCLREVSRKLLEVARRPGDFVSRYGGEEFTVILPMTDEKNARRIAEEILKKVESLKIAHEDSTISEYTTISAGVSTAVPGPASEKSFLIEKADKALYRAKNGGRNRVVCFDPTVPDGKMIGA